MIMNELDVPMNFIVQFDDRSLQQDRFSDWIDIDTKAVSLKPNESSPIPYTLRIPAEAEGEFYGRLSFAEAPKDGGSAVTIMTKISVPFVVIVEGTERYAARIKSFRVRKQNPVRVEVDLLNNGNVHMRPVGRCSITVAGDAAARNPVFEFPINSHRFPVYPNRKGTLVGNAEEALPEGSYIANVEFPYPDGDDVIVANFPFQLGPLEETP